MTSINAGGESGFSAAAEALTIPGTPLVTSIGAVGDAVTVKWSAMAPATSNKVYRQIDRRLRFQERRRPPS
ncbi:MAG: hypothetical protein MZW92_17865 [Comamonadaceae bacterium]|nr:hypothetical protein [Comamonadaceae bacterium]